jgi:hypothetical protein
MNERARAFVLLLTVLAIVHHLATLPAPFVPMKSADYCVIDYQARVKYRERLPSGEIVEGSSIEWVEGYGPCDQQDRFRDI